MNAKAGAKLCTGRSPSAATPSEPNEESTTCSEHFSTWQMVGSCGDASFYLIDFTQFYHFPLKGRVNEFGHTLQTAAAVFRSAWFPTR
jgi:hypothetical protein